MSSGSRVNIGIKEGKDAAVVHIAVVTTWVAGRPFNVTVSEHPGQLLRGMV